MTAYRNSWGNFREKNIEDYDEEAIKLYRNRDLDIPEYRRKSFTEVECKEGKYYKLYTSLSLSSVLYYPTDPNYYLLTEKEKLESGLETNVDLMFKSPWVFISLVCALTFAGTQYNKIYSPGGIILRTENKVSTFNWLLYRVPLTTILFGTLWYRYHFSLNKYIDFYSSVEDEIDKKLFDISGKKI